MDYIILRELTGVFADGTKNGFRTKMAGRDAPAVEPELKIEVADLGGLDEVADAQNDREVVAIAPSMPMALIEPFEAADGDASGDPWGVAAVGAEDCGFTGAGVRVAVLDTGIRSDHTAFTNLHPFEKDFTGTSDGDEQGHGTHCAATVFGRDVDGRRIGIAPGVTRPLIGKVLDSRGRGDTKMLFDAFHWAVSNGANIISLSLGFDFPGMVKRSIQTGLPEELAASIALQAYRDNLRLFDDLMRLSASAEMFGRGSVVIAATGNESRVDKDPRFRIGPSLPAAARGVISVGALERSASSETLRVASFSNSPPSVSAPGVDILSASHGGGLKILSGTSMACPHVAGVAALWWQWARENRPGEPSANVVRNCLLATASRDRLDPTVSPADRGAGLVQAPR